MSRLIIFCLIVIVVVSCKTEDTIPAGYSKTASGMLYKIYPANPAGDSVRKGDVVKLHLQQFIDDSLMNSTYGKMPEYIIIDSTLREFDYPELLPYMSTGDSAEAIFPIKTLRERTDKKVHIPAFLLKAKQVVVRFRILQKFPADSNAVADYAAEQAVFDRLDSIKEEKGYAVAALRFDSLIKSQKKVFQKLEEGIFIEIIRKGSGPAIQKGMELTMVHKGYSENGDLIESTTAEQPFKIVAGEEASIEGVAKAMMSLRVGDKVRLFVGAPKAYGARGFKGKVPPFANLIFEIEIIKGVQKHDS